MTELYIRNHEGVMQQWWPNFLSSISPKVVAGSNYVKHRTQILKEQGATFCGHYLLFEDEKDMMFFLLRFS